LQTAEGSHATTEAEAAFREFVPIVEPLLRTALIATYGPERGAEATAEALAYAWEHWNEVRKYEKPADYLYRVGQSRTRSRKVRDLFHRSKEQQYWVEPGLGAALSELSPGQRAAVVLVFAAGNTPTEAAELLGLSVSTVKTNTKRGLEHLRQSLGAIDDEQ
jgi:RNA polymerase sigma factor (sigma-70 family)